LVYKADTTIGDLSSSSGEDESEDEKSEEYVVTLLPERAQLNASTQKLSNISVSIQKREGKKRVKGIKNIQNEPESISFDNAAK
jgi:hypothetical protein